MLASARNAMVVPVPFALPMAFTFSYFPESGPVVYLGADLNDWDIIGAPRFEVGADGAFGEIRMTGKTIKKSDEVPADIENLTDDWIGQPIEDSEAGRPFAFLKAEVEFYRKHHIAPPRKHFSVRIRDLLFMSNFGTFEKKNCEKCGVGMLVGINRTFREKHAYCYDCYLKYLEERN